MNPSFYIALGIGATLVLATFAFFCGIFYHLAKRLGELAKSFDEMARSSDRLASTMYGLVPNLKHLHENLDRHVTHMGGLVAVIEAANRGQPPPAPTEPPKPEDEIFTPVMPPQVDWENPDGREQP